MEDLFYNAYAEELNKRNVGKFTVLQLSWCWFLVIWMFFSGLVLLGSYITNSYKYVAISFVTYILVATILGASLSWLEKKSQNGLFQGNQKHRIKSMRAAIDHFFLRGNYNEKITFLIALYYRAIKQREEREKKFRHACIYVLSAFCVILKNAIDSPKNQGWQTTLYIALTLVIIVGLVIGPIMFAGSFDSKKKTYNFMYVELQAIKLMQDDSVSVEN